MHKYIIIIGSLRNPNSYVLYLSQEHALIYIVKEFMEQELCKLLVVGY